VKNFKLYESGAWFASGLPMYCRLLNKVNELMNTEMLLVITYNTEPHSFRVYANHDFDFLST
jgi:hypothetical protein